METQNIINNFRLLAHAKKEVKFISDYKGLPIELDAAISNVFGDTVIFSTPKYKLASFSYKKQIFIQNEMFPEIIKSRIGGLDIARGSAILTDFKYVNPPLIKRDPLRIQPENSIEIVISKYEDAEMKAELIDVSESGMGIYTTMPLPSRTKVSIQLQFPGKETNTSLKIEVPGVTIYTVRENDTSGGIRYRIGIQIFPDKHTKHIILEYLSQRRAKLLDDINKYYEEHALKSL